MLRSLVFALVAISGISAVVAQDVKPVGDLAEHFYDSARSSGTGVVGAQIQAELDDERIDGAGHLTFSFYVPEEASADLFCVTTEAANGLYNGRGTFRVFNAPGVDDVAGRTLTAVYPTRHAGRLETLGPDELAISVRPGKCGRRSLDEGMSEETALELAVASWRPDQHAISRADAVRLLVNPFDAELMRVSVEGQAFPCTAIEVPVSASYSMACTIPLSALGSSPATLRLQTMVLGSTPESNFVKLHFPSP